MPDKSMPSQAPFDAIVTRSPRGSVPAYASLSAALKSVPSNIDTPFRILIEAGEWRERVVVDRPNIHLIGVDADKTVLVFNRHAGLPGSDGKPIGTFDTATMRVCASGFRAENLTIANDFDYARNLHLGGDRGQVGHHGTQAVALSIEGDADRSLFENVRLLGHQDTLYAHAGRSLFRNCRIEGSVDFIFGGGRAYFDSCRIVSRHRPTKEKEGFITAPNTARTQPVGFVFCTAGWRRRSPSRPAQWRWADPGGERRNSMTAITVTLSMWGPAFSSSAGWMTISRRRRLATDGL